MPRADDGGMDRGLYIAASGMLAEQIRQDQIANDLANASTPGYKADRTAQRTFGDLLLHNSATGATVGSQAPPSQVDEMVTDFTAQPLRDTGEPLDFAITGEGFFAVQTAQGMRYTRNGQFTAAAQGRLVDQLGDPVLGRNGQPVHGRRRRQRRPARRRRRLRRDQPAQAGRQPLHRHRRRAAATGQVRAGALEGSGADPARSMVDMIASLRAFEAGQKVIHDDRRDARQGRHPGRLESSGPSGAPPPSRPTARGSSSTARGRSTGREP